MNWVENMNRCTGPKPKEYEMTKLTAPPELAPHHVCGECHGDPDLCDIHDCGDAHKSAVCAATSSEEVKEMVEKLIGTELPEYLVRSMK